MTSGGPSSQIVYQLPSMFCMLLQTDAANLNLFSASKRALQTLLQSLWSSFCEEVMVRETLAVFSVSSLNRRNETVQNSLHPQTGVGGKCLETGGRRESPRQGSGTAGFLNSGE